MTEKELNEVYFINKEIRRIQKELLDLKEKNFYKSNVLSDMPKGGIKKDIIFEYAEDVCMLESMLTYNLKKLQKKRAEAEEFLSTVEDAELRLIIRLRAINNMGWEDIGAEVGMERTTVSKKYRNYLKFPTNPVQAVIL